VVEDSNIPILELPYSDRQLVFVTADRVAEAARKQRAEALAVGSAGAAPTMPPWRGIGGLVGVLERIVTPKQGLTDELKSFEQSLRDKDWKKIASASFEVALKWTPYWWIGAAAVEAVRAWARARESGIQILPIGKTEATTIKFPPGHPRDGVLYIGHPALPTVYYPMAEFHRVTFEHKFCEAIELLMSLGATSLRVERVTGWSKEFLARIAAPLGTAQETATVDAGLNSASRLNLLYEASLPGTDKPAIPEDLVWYWHEPTWQSVAKGRIMYGLSDFSLTVTYEDDFGINACLKAAVVNAGLDLGGRFEDHVSTVWRIEGKFNTPSENRKLLEA
jgi:hypothetical protein